MKVIGRLFLTEIVFAAALPFLLAARNRVRLDRLGSRWWRWRSSGSGRR